MHSSSNDIYGTLSIGIVVDTNDPQQMGRVRARVAAFGDTPNSILENLPWCRYVSPFGGVTTQLSRGNENETSEGAVAYGMWNIPKLGAQVLVGCLEGDPASRFWLGCLFDEQLPHTMPHGRFSYQSSNGSGQPEGPLTSGSAPVQPLYKNWVKAFKSFVNNFEWRTRGADRSVTGFTQQIKDTFPYEPFESDDEDVTFTEQDGKQVISRQGYDLSRIDPQRKPKETKQNLDSQVYAWTTPGFHAISMDDRLKNCRMRLRTATGHQILLDDTNERIYISTNEGANWIEMDSDGSIDIFGTQRISIHAENDINLTSNKTIRMYAKDSIHMHADNEIRTHSVKDTHVVTDANLRTRSTLETRLLSNGNLHLRTEASFFTHSTLATHLFATTTFNAQSGTNFNMKSGAAMFGEASTDSHFKAGANFITFGETTNVVKSGGAILFDGANTKMSISGSNLNLYTPGTLTFKADQKIVLDTPEYSLNASLRHISAGATEDTVTQSGVTPAAGTTASGAGAATSAVTAGETLAFWTNRVPEHEPWGRISTLNDYSHQPKLNYTDPNIGKEHKTRGPYWHR